LLHRLSKAALHGDRQGYLSYFYAGTELAMAPGRLFRQKRSAGCEKSQNKRSFPPFAIQDLSHEQ
jgi:hypothetical protein